MITFKSLGVRHGKGALMKVLGAMLEKQPVQSDPYNLLDAMAPVSQSGGSRYGEDVIRITGSDEFCEAVLWRLRDLVEVENNRTRLDCSWSEVKDTEINGKKKSYNGSGGNTIYLRKANRGREAQMMRAMLEHYLEGDA